VPQGCLWTGLVRVLRCGSSAWQQPAAQQQWRACCERQASRCGAALRFVLSHHPLTLQQLCKRSQVHWLHAVKFTGSVHMYTVACLQNLPAAAQPLAESGSHSFPVRKPCRCMDPRSTTSS
jgi:hypothetical protein